MQHVSMNHVDRKKRWHWKSVKFYKLVERINGIVEVWLIVGVTTTCSKTSVHSMQHAPYQGPKPNMPHDNPGMLQGHMQLCSLFGELSISQMWTSDLSQTCYMGLISRFWMANPWHPGPGSPGNSYWLGLCFQHNTWKLPRLQKCTVTIHNWCWPPPQSSFVDRCW